MSGFKFNIGFGQNPPTIVTSPLKLFIAGSPAILTTSGSSGGSFSPQTNFSGTGSITDGGTFTINLSGGGFGTKPVDPRPLIWIDPATTGNINPSTLGRTSTSNNSTGLSYSSSGGPTGAGWAQGSAVVSGDTGNQKKWTQALDVDAWGAGSPKINDYSAKFYMWRTMIRNFGHYDENTSTYNIKNFRVYARVTPATPDSAGQTQPDFYMSVSNQRPTTEGMNSYTPVPDFTRPGQAGGSADAVAEANVIANDGGLPGTPDAITFNRWFSEEIVWQANQNDPGSTPPTPDNTSILFNWYVEGKYSNAPTFATPVQTYQWNQWYLRGAGMADVQRWYYWHYIVDGTGGRPMVPIGSYVGYGPTLVDDSWCRVHLRDNSTRASYTLTEVQPTSAWSNTSVTVTLRKGRLSSGVAYALIVTDNTGTEHYAGTVTF